jgi:hypothetical protein
MKLNVHLRLLRILMTFQMTKRVNCGDEKVTVWIGEGDLVPWEKR